MQSFSQVCQSVNHQMQKYVLKQLSYTPWERQLKASQETLEHQKMSIGKVLGNLLEEGDKDRCEDVIETYLQMESLSQAQPSILVSLMSLMSLMSVFV